ncbi:Fic family protein [Sulfurospirillum multivorans]|uniref:Fic family protein n=2 Tax=Sulfurospirillum multivorans TaxID=66821 RepID=A0AA86DZ72_SULMK|nr:Fic family protein [Sulfurospirillum multivorans]AHJ14063.1 Fic family protein [Sulfurospirillum multivorans DSM 12446]QEH07550.1 Fic family protein [Sulfurospirillum multivorans]
MADEYIPAPLPLTIELETKAILKKVISANRALAELKGVANSIPNQHILINALSLQEAKDSSEIENIITTHDELYRASVSSVAISQQAKEVQRYREALYTGFSLIGEHRLLLKKHIIEIQKVLEGNDAGMRSQSGTVLKNEQSGEVVFMPPQNPQTIHELMDNLEQYINTPKLDDLDALIKMAIVHYQFEAIHPFYDGNGRTGRIVNILFLMLSGLLDIPILYLSSHIIKNKSEYYRLLRAVSSEGAWQEWVLYMLEGVEQTAQKSIVLINAINTTMQESKEIILKALPKLYSKELLELLFKHPYTKINFLVEELGITRKTATNYLKALEEIGILASEKKGREVYFINKRLFELLKNSSI